MVLGVVAMVARKQIESALGGVSFAEAVGIAAVVFLVSAGLLWLAMLRFRRARLILE
jgi:hypothetical protein